MRANVNNVYKLDNFIYRMKKGVIFGFIIVSILIVSLSFVSAFSFGDWFENIWNSITGKSVDINNMCNDTDGGKDYFKKGVINFTDGSEVDVCEFGIGSNYLREWYCGYVPATRYSPARYYSFETYECPDGCVEGACIDLNASFVSSQSVCNDTDGGKDPYVKGSANGFNDECRIRYGYQGDAEHYVSESYCGDVVLGKMGPEGPVFFEQIDCLNGCVDGACKCSSDSNCPINFKCQVSTGKCLEGRYQCAYVSKDYTKEYLKNNVSVEMMTLDFLGKYVFDGCLGGTKISEAMCNTTTGQAYSKIVDCPDSYVCAENACKICTDGDKDNNCKEFGDCNDANSNVYLTASEICDGFDNDCNGAVDNGALCPKGSLCSNGACIIDDTFDQNIVDGISFSKQLALMSEEDLDSSQFQSVQKQSKSVIGIEELDIVQEWLFYGNKKMNNQWVYASAGSSIFIDGAWAFDETGASVWEKNSQIDVSDSWVYIGEWVASENAWVYFSNDWAWTDDVWFYSTNSWVKDKKTGKSYFLDSAWIKLSNSWIYDLVDVRPNEGFNQKDMSKYSNDEVFLISDKNWKDVLPLVPVTTWTQQNGGDSECQRGYGTAEDVCVYPTLIYHDEELSYYINYEKIENLGEILNIGTSSFYNDSLVYYSLNGLIIYNVKTGKKEVIADYACTVKMNDKYVLYETCLQSDLILYDRLSKSKEKIAGGNSFSFSNNYILFTKEVGTTPPIDGWYRRINDIYLTKIKSKETIKIAENTISADEIINSDKYAIWTEFLDGKFYLNVYTFAEGATEKILLDSYPTNLYLNGDDLFFLKDYNLFSYNLINKIQLPIILDKKISEYSIYGDKILYVFDYSLVYLTDFSNSKNELISKNLDFKYSSPIIYEEGFIFAGVNGDFDSFFFISNSSIKSSFIEKKSFDVDSSIHFMQQFKTGKVKIVGDTPQELDNLLIAEPDFGAGINSNNIQRIYPKDYLFYWESYNDVVYVEDNYELGLMASTYASLINAPLIIEGTALDNEVYLNGRHLICVGEVNKICDEYYGLEQLQQKYVEKTNTDKIILVNPNDLDIKLEERFQSEKSLNPIYNLYGKNSLVAPILASAKHEIIISNTSVNYTDISNFIKDRINLLVPYILENSQGFKKSFVKDQIYKKNIDSGDLFELNLPVNLKEEIYGLKGFEDKLGIIKYSSDGSSLFYDVNSNKFLSVSLDFDNMFDYSNSLDKIVYAEYDSNFYTSNILLYDIDTNEKSLIDTFGNQVKLDPLIKGEYLVWAKNIEGKCSNNHEVACFDESDCESYCYQGGDSCNLDSECGDGDFCTDGFCSDALSLSFKNINSENVEKIEDGTYFRELFISGSKMAYYNYNLNTHTIYDFKLKGKENFEMFNSRLFGFDNNNLLFVNSISNELYLYNLVTKEKVALDTLFSDWNYYQSNPKIYGDKVVWVGKDLSGGGFCYKDSSISCSSDKDCEDNWGCTGSAVYSYDINTKEKKLEYSSKEIRSLSLVKKDIFFVSNKYYNSFIYGYLTLFGAPNAIPIKEEMGRTGSWDNARSLDSSEYADVYLEDGFSDLAVGRIQGITISDVSSYVGRDLLYSKIGKTNNIALLLGDGEFDWNGAFNSDGLKIKKWALVLEKIGYSVKCLVGSGASSECLNFISPEEDWPIKMMNTDLIFIGHHGSPTFAGIYLNQIPVLEKSMVILASCSTCASSDGNSFCNNIMRRGAISNIAALSIAWGGNPLYYDFMNKIYGKNNLDIGTAFAASYNYDIFMFMTTLLGDPTFNPEPDYKFEEEVVYDEH